MTLRSERAPIEANPPHVVAVDRLTEAAALMLRAGRPDMARLINDIATQIVVTTWALRGKSA